MKFSSILLVAVSLVAISCERHEFDGPNGTKQLNESHGATAHDTHAPAAEHPEKKAAH